MGVRLQEDRGQMTVEFMVVLPVLLIVGIVAVNSLLFFSECAAFDRIARDVIRVHTCSPAYGQQSEHTLALVEQTIQERFNKEYLDSSVSTTGTVSGHVTYTATLTFFPTLFGMGMRSEILGVALPSFTHSLRFTVDTYKPGVLL